MNKQDVISHYGTATKVATAIGVSKATVSLWKEVIPWKYALLIEKVSDGQLKYDHSMYQENDNSKASA